MIGSSVIDPLVNGDEISGVTTVTVKETTPPGSYFIIGCADAAKKIVESNKSNNCLASDSLIDISIDNIIRTIAAGDSWYYTATGKLQTPYKTAKLSGSATSQILSYTEQSPITLDNCLDQYTVMTLKVSGYPTMTIGSHTYTLQDDNSSLYSYGMDIGQGATWADASTTGKFLSLESPIEVGQTSGDYITFDDGSTMAYAYSVDSIEHVNTGLGKFWAYRVTINETYNYVSGEIDQMVGTITNWYVPEIGIVKSKTNASSYIGGVFQFSMSYTVTLKSTTVDY